MNRPKQRFGDFVLDVESGQLFRDSRPVKIQPQPLRVLAILAERAGELVSRDELRTRIWDTATFVEFDQGLNYAIRQIRIALGDSATSPGFIETVKGLGYRFVAPVTTDAGTARAADPVPEPSVPPASSLHFEFAQVVLGVAVAVAAIAGLWFVHRQINSSSLPPRAAHDIRQMTEFADSAMAPALSSDGQLVAFIRGSSDFLTPDQIYVKMLPDGEARRLTDDPRLKYGPAFSPDGSEVAYTVMEHQGWSTYAVSVLGGAPRLVLTNAAGLTWLDRGRVLFSQIKSGQHMGVVTSGEARDGLHEVYFPLHERAMAHYSTPSPDRQLALVVEMGQDGSWESCRLISLEDRFASRPVGPAGRCDSAAWAPDGQTMYFTAMVDGEHHLWRQPYPNGSPEQLTFGPTSEIGIAVDRDGTSVLTSIGVRESTLWMHDAGGDRQLSSEGQALDGAFSPDGTFLYYLLQREAGGGRRELRRIALKSGLSEIVLPGTAVLEFDLSTDGRQVVYATATVGGGSQLWVAPIDRSAPSKRVGRPGDNSPYFGPGGDILFRFADGRFNYLGRMKADGSGRSRAVPYPISEIQGVSPARNWVMAIAPLPDNTTVAPMAIPLSGGSPIRVCEIYCHTAWSTNGRFLYVSVEESSLASAGRALAVPVGPGEMLPAFPASGVPPLAESRAMAGARSVKRGQFIAGADPDTFAYVQTSVHRNLFRVSIDRP